MASDGNAKAQCVKVPCREGMFEGYLPSRLGDGWALSDMGRPDETPSSRVQATLRYLNCQHRSSLLWSEGQAVEDRVTFWVLV